MQFFVNSVPVCGDTVPLGVQGENLATQITADVSGWLAQWPDGQVIVRLIDANRQSHLADTVVDDGTLVWIVTAADTAQGGYGVGVIELVQGDVVKKSEPFATRVITDPQASGQAPEPVPGWVEETIARMEELEASAAQSADAAQTSAQSAQTGAQSAQAAADQAAQSAEDAAAVLRQVETAGAAQVTAIQAAGQQQTQAVTAAGAQQVSAVQAEGADQRAAIETAGAAQVNAVQAEGQTQQTAIQQKGADTLASIPADYTELSGDVADLKSHVEVNSNSIEDLHVKLKYYQKTYTIRASTEHPSNQDKTSALIVSGESFRVDISANATVSSTSTINIKAFYADGTEEFVFVGCKVPSVTELTASKDIIEIGFWSGSAFATTDVIVTAEIYVDGTVLEYDRFPLPEMDSLQIKTFRVFDSFETNHVTYNFRAGATIENYSDYASASSVGYNTPPVKIRNKNGVLVYKNLHLTAATDSQVYAMWTFDKNGRFIRYVTIEQYRARTASFLDDEFYAILNQYTTIAANEWRVSNIDIEWLNNPNKAEYVVGNGGDYATFTAALRALQGDESEKTIYIQPGEYSIFEEMGGAAYMQEVSAQSGLNWRDICPVVPPNTTIIGRGNVVLKWDASAAQMVNSTVAFLFSPLNLSGTCRIVNVNIIAQNCRYAVHDETSGNAVYNGARHSFERCNFTMLQGTYGGAAYGAGHNKLMILDFADCVFVSENDNNIWSTHDWPTQLNEASSFVFRNCVFKSSRANAYVNFSSSDTYGRQDKVLFSNCYLKRINYTTDGGSAKQGYKVMLIGCSQVDVQYTDAVTDRYDTDQYNSIAQN